MPALLLHLTLAREALDQEGAPAAVARAGRDHPADLLLGAILPDLPYHARFGQQVVRHLARADYRPSEWGDIFHYRATGRFGLALLAHLRRSFPGEAERGRLLAFAAGYLSHHAVDRTVHPAIQAVVAARLRPADSHQSLHARVERYQSLFYHLDRLGQELFPSPLPRRMTAQTAGVHLTRPGLDPLLRDALRVACLQVHGRAPAPRQLRDWLRGIASYGWLMSSPAGRLEGLPPDHQRLRAKWYHGPEVDLETPLKASLAATARAWQAAERVILEERLDQDSRKVFMKTVPDADLATGH